MTPNDDLWGRRMLRGEWSIHGTRSPSSVLMELQSLDQRLKFRRDQIGELMARKRELQKLMENGKLQQKVKAQQTRLEEQQRELEGWRQWWSEKEERKESLREATDETGQQDAEEPELEETDEKKPEREPSGWWTRTVFKPCPCKNCAECGFPGVEDSSED
jgi:hypothetical protein